MPHTNPISAWASLRDGNHRFVDCEMRHPSQNTQRREQLVAAQHPKAVLFGCSDSRVAAEIIFDQGLGDLFVIRTAGHIIDTAVLGSIEYAVHVLDTPLIVVLGHDSCGAVKATVDALATGEIPPGFLRDVVEKVSPSILNGRREGLSGIDDFEARHVLETGELLEQRSKIISERIDNGELAIVGVTYKLSDGRAYLRSVLGEVEDVPHGPGEEMVAI
ncbi:carbonic anhydrase [Dietzia maris]|jgi:carbonic anhydrase|uniref:Carbonic anhydrase n=1 Tax=Dietzia maris TaxID=37915 RepID=A0A365P6J7_9ACTN|nr:MULTISPECIES: carbonic anhydrase [Dietzia]MBB0991282.1 carbonic anhydrase [Dietzia sp. SLG510A3-30A2]MBB0993658.1 carbonic anhydrase [Dietzia sp. SLG510A3-40A3]MBB1009783.1 carbonic anhydrase [Dietzia sp. SLG510A3-3B2-2]MBB0996091.1 carbonic anhydrase [Dietzia maris]RBA30534.1 carbonic anhydrase [Dietzia maris]